MEKIFVEKDPGFFLFFEKSVATGPDAFQASPGLAKSERLKNNPKGYNEQGGGQDDLPSIFHDGILLAPVTTNPRERKLFEEATGKIACQPSRKEEVVQRFHI